MYAHILSLMIRYLKSHPAFNILSIYFHHSMLTKLTVIEDVQTILTNNKIPFTVCFLPDHQARTSLYSC
jgi:hypothetical protein